MPAPSGDRATLSRDLADFLIELSIALHKHAMDPERTGQPLGLGDRDRLAAWPHVQLHALTYERLELTDQSGPAAGEGDARAAQLWVGLARAALATAPEDTRPTPTEPAVIAQAIDEHSKAEATGYDQVIVGYLLQIAAELKSAGSAEAAALRRRTSRLIRTLKPETLQRLVRMGGDFAQRRQFVSDAADGMAVDAVLDILKAAAESSHAT